MQVRLGISGLESLNQPQTSLEGRVRSKLAGACLSLSSSSLFLFTFFFFLGCKATVLKRMGRRNRMSLWILIWRNDGSQQVWLNAMKTIWSQMQPELKRCEADVMMVRSTSEPQMWIISTDGPKISTILASNQALDYSMLQNHTSRHSLKPDTTIKSWTFKIKIVQPRHKD